MARVFSIVPRVPPERDTHRGEAVVEMQRGPDGHRLAALLDQLQKAVAEGRAVVVLSSEQLADRSPLGPQVPSLGGGDGTPAPRDGEPDAQAVAAIASLSLREREVLGLLAEEGLRNREIAERLSISEKTVRHHVSTILGKLGVEDRCKLIVYAYNHSALVTAGRPANAPR